MSRSAAALPLLLALVAACDSSDSSGGRGETTSFAVTWTFDSGDCASNGIEDVRVTWGPWDGAGPFAPTGATTFSCSTEGGLVGPAEPGGTYGIGAMGFDAGGVQRAESFGAFVHLGTSVPPTVPVQISFHPRPGDVTVTWALSGGGGCPAGAIIPYNVKLYESGALTYLTLLQETCTAQQATFTRVAPGSYVVKIDSVTTSPSVHGTASVTVVAGEDAQAHVSL